MAVRQNKSARISESNVLCIFRNIVRKTQAVVGSILYRTIFKGNRREFKEYVYC